MTPETEHWGFCLWICDCGRHNRWEITVCRCGHVRTPDDRRWWADVLD